MKGRTYMSEINGILEKNNIFNVRSLTETDLPSLTQLFNYNDEGAQQGPNDEKGDPTGQGQGREGDQ